MNLALSLTTDILNQHAAKGEGEADEATPANLVEDDD